MNTKNIEYAGLLAGFASSIQKYVKGLSSQRISIDKQHLQEMFMKNYEADQKIKPQQANKDDIHKQERQKQQKINEKQNKQHSIVQNGNIQINLANQQQKHDYISRKARDDANLQRIKHMQSLRAKMTEGDESAGQQLKQTQKQNAIRRLQGEKIQDNEYKIKKQQRQRENEKKRNQEKWSQNGKKK